MLGLFLLKFSIVDFMFYLELHHFGIILTSTDRAKCPSIKSEYPVQQTELQRNQINKMEGQLYGMSSEI